MAFVPILDEAIELLTDYATEKVSSKADDLIEQTISEQSGLGKSQRYRSERSAGGRGKGPRTPSTMSNPNPPPNVPPREAATTTVSTNADAAGGGMDIESHAPHSHSVISAGLSGNHTYFDSNLLQSPGEKSLVRLQIKLGKQVYPDVITPFLKQLNGNGKIRMQFAGRCLAAINARHVHLQSFRHRLSQTTSEAAAAWPAGAADFILGPQNTTAFAIAGGTTTAGYALNTSSLRDMLNGKCYWAPYNVADLEDLSWNLNSMKLGNPTWTTGATLPSLEPNVPLFATDSHARISRIAQNNVQSATLPGSSAGATTAPYRYNAVFNKGNVLYNFMNKGLGGAKIELIVYRAKKNAQLQYSGTQYAATPNTIPLSRVSAAIGAGYINTQIAKAGTDALLGREPLVTDIVDSPAFPFLPELKKTQQSQNPFVEISRQTFAMPSGSRRELNIVLPGSVYDPTNIPSNPSATEGLAAQSFPEVIDHGTFCVVISVSGQKCTQEISRLPATVPPTVFNIGDMYAGADIQFYATYTEHMGSCQYKHSSVAQMYTGGALLMPEAPANYSATPITMLPQNQAVRLPAPDASGAGHNLAASMHAEPLPP